MTEEIKRVFDRDGFVIIRDYLSDDEVSEMRERTDRDLTEILPGLPEASGYKGTLKHLNKHDRWFRDYLEHGRHVPLLETLIEDALAPDGVIWNDKPARASFPTPPHQDAIGCPRVPPRGCSMWIALDPVDRDNGCLYYARGSHRSGLIQSYRYRLSSRKTTTARRPSSHPAMPWCTTRGPSTGRTRIVPIVRGDPSRSCIGGPPRRSTRLWQGSSPRRT